MKFFQHTHLPLATFLMHLQSERNWSGYSIGEAELDIAQGFHTYNFREWMDRGPWAISMASLFLRVILFLGFFGNGLTVVFTSTFTYRFHFLSDGGNN